MSNLVLLIEEVLQAVQILDLRPKHLRVKISYTVWQMFRDSLFENQLKRNVQTVITNQYLQVWPDNGQFNLVANNKISSAESLGVSPPESNIHTS